MITITRRLEFDYGHRVLGHEGKCRHLHGHRGVAEVSVTGPALDAVGRVVDFGVVKEVVGGWIDRNWDHNLLLNAEDPLVPVLAVYEGANGRAVHLTVGNPTAENMAAELFDVASALLPGDLRVTSVRVWETPNCSAEFRPDYVS